MPFIVISTRAASEPAHNKCCGSFQYGLDTLYLHLSGREGVSAGPLGFLTYVLLSGILKTVCKLIMGKAQGWLPL
jgi:hypothetical protein